MKKLLILFTIVIIILGITSCKKEEKVVKPDLPDGLYAKIKTNKGDITLSLTYKKTPLTVTNFVGLAEGKIENSAKKPGEPFYNGIKFHRVIANFMIQGGDPTGTGMGDPNIPNILDEFVPGHSNVRGTISMANAGPNTGSSQFFINLIDNSRLDYDKEPLSSKHPVFGEVVEGMDVVDKIAKVQTGVGDKPVEDVIIEKAVVL